MVALGHSKNKGGYTEDLRTHLTCVANRAAEYAAAFNASNEAYVAGILHDLGKYGASFQARLHGQGNKVDHWSCGAWEALTRFKNNGLLMALAIQGHHIGLQKAAKDEFRALDPTFLRRSHPLGRILSEGDKQCLENDGVEIPQEKFHFTSRYNDINHPSVSGMLDVRMLYSTLTDADFIETEAHFEGDVTNTRIYRKSGPTLKAQRDLSALLSHIESISQNAKASPVVLKLRKDLLDSCVNTAAEPTGLFNLTAPTGAGKTLSMLAFALRHALIHNLRRIVFVIPYLSIIEQTALEYRKVFSSIMNEYELNHYILEDHSLSQSPEPPQSDLDNYDMNISCTRQKALLAENWDAPIIITTSVQFFESLFSNRPAACRKLHRLAQSVILFDEVQTLPVSLCIPSLAALAHLSKGYGSSIVFSTATQPAFSDLNEYIAPMTSTEWRPVNIAGNDLNLFSRIRRMDVLWPDLDKRIAWEKLAEDILERGENQALIIVNIKQHAVNLFNVLQNDLADGLFHLSTNMCPLHRQNILETVRERLKRGEDCILVSTQCVEAGVDLDFPAVYRAFGPLESIAQAAGRCNRNGLSQRGTVHVFIPEDEKYPDRTYEQAAGVLRILLQQKGNLDIHDPEIYNEYYRMFYDFTRPQERKRDLTEAIHNQDFAEAAREYRLIENNTINILVPYDMEAYGELCDEVRKEGISGRWIRKARPYSISVFRQRAPQRTVHDIRSFIEPVPVINGKTSEDWFIYLMADHYDSRLGLVIPKEMDFLNV